MPVFPRSPISADVFSKVSGSRPENSKKIRSRKAEAPSSHVNNVYGVHCVQHQQVVEYFLELGHTRIGCIIPTTMEEISMWKKVKEKLQLETLFLVSAKGSELCQEILEVGEKTAKIQPFGFQRYSRP